MADVRVARVAYATIVGLIRKHDNAVERIDERKAGAVIDEDCDTVTCHRVQRVKVIPCARLRCYAILVYRVVVPRDPWLWR